MGGVIPVMGIQGPAGPAGPAGAPGAGLYTQYTKGAIALAHSGGLDDEQYAIVGSNNANLVVAFAHNTSGLASNLSMSIYSVDPTTPGATPFAKVFGNGAFFGDAIAAGAYLWGPAPQISGAPQGLVCAIHCDDLTHFWVRVINTGFANDITVDYLLGVVTW